MRSFKVLYAGMMLFAGFIPFLEAGCSYDFGEMAFPCAPPEMDAGDEGGEPRCPPGYYCSEDEKCLRGDCADDQDCKGEGEFCIDHRCVVPEAPEATENADADAETTVDADEGVLEEVELELPQIIGFTPVMGPVWSKVEIQGENFDTVLENNEVRFHDRDENGNIDQGIVAVLLEVSPAGDRLLVRVPEGASGKGPISVKTPKGEAVSDTEFEVTNAPYIKEFEPMKGVPGTEVTIRGYNFSDSPLVPNEVSFNGTAAPDALGTTTEIKTTVPEGATTGPIMVKVGDQSNVSEEDFEVIGPPEITDFFPKSGFPGQRVTIFGANFDGDTPGNNVVSFKGAQVPEEDLLLAESDRLVVKVPSGAASGPITVSVGGREVVSTDSFTVTSGHPANGDVISTVETGIGTAPAGIAVSADNRYAYVVLQGTEAVLVLDGDMLPADPNAAKVANIGVGLVPTGIATSPDGKFVLVTNTNLQQVWVLDESKMVTEPDNCLYGKPIQAPGGPEQIAVDPTGKIAVVLKKSSAKLTRIDMHKLVDDPEHALLGDLEMKLGTNLLTRQYNLDFSDSGERLVLTGVGSNQNKSFLVYMDLVSEKIKNATPLGTDLRGVALSPDGVTSYSADFGEGAERIAKYNHVDNKLSTWIPIAGCKPYGLVKTPDGSQMYVTCVDLDNDGASNLYILDTASNTVSKGPVPLCAGAFNIAFARNGTRAYVSCFMDDKVMVVQ